MEALEMEANAALPEEATTTDGTAAAAAAVVGGENFVEIGENTWRENCSGDGGGGLCTAENAYTMMTTAVSGLQLFLSVANAVDSHGFKFNTLRRAIFGGSAVVEGIGFLFAVKIAHERWVCEGGGGGVGGGVGGGEVMRGSGSPIMIILETPAPSLGAEWLRERNDAMMLALGAQALAFWYCMTVHWYIWGLSGGVFAGAVAVAWSATVVIFHAYQHQRGGARQSGEHHALLRATSEGRNSTYCQSCSECVARVPAVLVALLPPIVINVTESFLIFSGTLATPAAYLLAILDLAVAIPVVHYVAVNFARLVCRGQKGSA